MQYYIIWTVIFVVLCVVEANTANLLTIWFAAGALIALIAAALGVPPVWQFWIFVITSLVLLAATRPLVKRKLTLKKEKTNADRVIGKTALVKESITPDKFSGTVVVAGQVWSAITSDGSTAEAGDEVIVEAIDGVKLVVAHKNKVEA